MPIVRINHFEANPGLEDQLHAFLHSIITVIETSPGCRSCRLLRAVDNPAQLAIIEEWDSIDAHQQAAKAIPPAKLAEVMPLLAKPAHGMYYHA